MLVWNLKRFYKKLFVVGEGQTNSQKITLFIYSTTAGLLIALIFVSFFQANPFDALWKGVKRTFTTDLKIQLMVGKVIVLGLAGIAVGVGFKTGIFNIGVSGQMMVGGLSAGLLALNLGDQIPNGAGQVLVLLICVIGGSVFAGIAGLLKAYFNIHEVVSTILMNWIAFFCMKWMFDPNTSKLLDVTMQTSKAIHPNYLLRIDSASLWPTLIILALTSFLVWVFIYKTKYGMILKMTSLNANATKYAGVNTKLVITLSMMISGAVAGLLGAVVYFGIQNQFQVPMVDVIPEEGFNGIAISIISYSNPLLTVVVAFLFGMIQSGIINTASLANSISPTFISLVLGILMYISAVSALFIRLKWMRFARALVYSKAHNKLYYKYKQKKHKLDEMYYSEYSFATSMTKQVQTLKTYWIAHWKARREFSSALKGDLTTKQKDDLIKNRAKGLAEIKKACYEKRWQVSLVKTHREKLKNLKIRYIINRNKIILNKGVK